MPSILALLRDRADREPDRVAYVHLANGAPTASLTFADVATRAAAVADRLRGLAPPGARALLLYLSGPAFLDALLGCLAAGLVAVPAFPPRPGRADRTLGLLGAIAADCEPRLVLTTGDMLARLAPLDQAPEVLRGPRWLATDGLAREASTEAWMDPPPTQPALLQYTSGSTSAPRGVVVTHANLLQSQRAASDASDVGAEDVWVSWLPLHHDMGLSAALNAIAYGATCALMSPAEFVQRPHRWLEAISTYRATVSVAPNIAYDLCVDRVAPEQRAGLDLSSWRIAGSGGEPIRVETMRRFADAFGPFGFRWETFHPAYGLAEATCYVTGKPAGSAPSVLWIDAAALTAGRIAPAPADAEGARPIVGCGIPSLDTRVEIVDPDLRHPTAPDRVGEIWIAGSVVATGYWQRPTEGAATFGARLANGEGPFLRTGDLGFLYDAQLYVTGRLKDLIILGGVNRYPQDLEQSAERSHPAIRRDGCAAFPLEQGGQEQVALVVEVERTARNADPDEIALAVRRAVARDHQVTPGRVVLVRPGVLPRTTSGKVQRWLCRSMLLAGDFDERAVRP